MLAARDAFRGETATWPSPETPTAFYERTGERIQKNVTENFTFKWYVRYNDPGPMQSFFSRFNYTVVVYWPAQEVRELCVLNLANDVFYEVGYKNINYFVSRNGADRKGIDLEKRWQRFNDSGTLEAVKTRFM